MTLNTAIETAPPLAERVFPDGDPRDGHVLLLDYVQTWESQFLGLGRATRVLSENVLRRSHAADDLGLSLIFLQCHRVEVGLKLLLERTSGVIATGHKLKSLMKLATAACRESGLGVEWAALVATQGDFVGLMDSADENAATYRYPVDTAGKPWTRQPYVDVEELGNAGEAFERDLLGVVHAADLLEPLPSVVDANHILEVLTALSDAGRAAAGSGRAIIDTMRAEQLRLSGTVSRQTDETNVMAASDAVAEVTMALADRVDRMAARFAAVAGAPAARQPAPAMLAFPRLDPSKGPAGLRRQQQAQIKWVVDTMIVWMRPLAVAIRSAESLTADWSTPAARQLHLDVSRFRSRFGAAAPQVQWPEV